MRSAPVAAVPASPPDYFSVFGLPRRFGLDRTGLERKFYELSRTAHPDRFTQADSGAQREALERMSLLNDAYRTLKDPALLREYVLQLEGVEVPKAGSTIPAELAESWFDLQDALMEPTDTTAAKVAEFEKELAGMLQKASGRLMDLEKLIDQAVESERGNLMNRLMKEIQAQSYLKSMERDVERIKKRL